MNKRQAKKKNKMFAYAYANSYSEDRKIARAYHEHCIEVKRREKKCIAMGCPHYMKGFGCFECFWCTKI